MSDALNFMAKDSLGKVRQELYALSLRVDGTPDIAHLTASQLLDAYDSALQNGTLSELAGQLSRINDSNTSLHESVGFVQAAANQAIASADGKSKVFHDANPTGMVTGDTWFAPDGTIKEYNGTEWVDISLSGSVIESLDAVKVVGEITGGQIASGAITSTQLAAAINDSISQALSDSAQASSDASSALAAANSAVVGTTIEYAVGSSETVAPTTGWSSNTPTRTAGTFIWMRTVITYGDTTTTTTNPALVTGNTGSTGTNGTTYYTWLKYADTPTTGMSDSPTDKTYMGLAYNKTSATESTDYADYSWSLIKGEQGIAGTNGTTTYTWVKYGTSAVGAGLNDDPTGMTYIGLAFNKTTATESTNAADYSWSLIQGPQGIQGSAGTNGTNGTTFYTWLKYADSPTTGMSDSPAGKTYMGISYNQTSSTESSLYTDYAWSLIKGTDGIPGTNGTDGTTTYTWVKYGTSAAGAGLNDSPTGMTYIGLAFNKTTATESTNAADYSWSLIQGPQGNAGLGVSSVTSYYYQTSGSAPAAPTTMTPPAGWSATEQAYSAGTTMYRTERIVYTDNSFAYTTVTVVSAYTAASQAFVLASGKNKVVYSTADASGTTGYVQGDMWVKRDGSNRIVGTWQYTGSAWVSTPFDASAVIAAGTVTGNLIAANTITAAMAIFQSGAIQNADIGNLSADKINAGTLAADRIAANSIAASKLIAATITAASGIIADAAITNAKIADATITSAKIHDLDVGKLTAGSIAAGQKIIAGTTDGQRTEMQPDGVHLYADDTAQVTHYDVFDRTTFGANVMWETWSGAWTIATGAAKPTYTAGVEHFAVIGTGFSDATLTADITTSATANRTHIGFGFRATDIDNYLECIINIGDGTGANQLRLRKVVNGTGTVLGTWTTTAFSAGTTYGIKVVTNGSSVQCYVGTTLAISVTETFNQTATFHGIWAYTAAVNDNGGSRVEWFNVVRLGAGVREVGQMGTATSTIWSVLDHNGRTLASADSTGTVSGRVFNADEYLVRGVPLTEQFAKQAWGLQVYGESTTFGEGYTTEQTYLEVQFQTVPGRMYRIYTNPISYQASVGAVFKLKTAWNAVAGTGGLTRIERSAGPDETGYPAAGPSLMFTVASSNYDMFSTVLTWYATSGWADIHAANLYVEDVGWWQPQSGIDRVTGSPTPPSSSIRRTSVWKSSDTHSWRDDSGGITNDSDLYQGFLSSGRSGHALFNDPAVSGATGEYLADEMSGSVTIHSVTFGASCLHTWYGSGADIFASPSSATSLTKPGFGNSSSAHTSAGQWVSIDLTDNWTTSHRSVCTGASWIMDQSHYAYLDGSSAELVIDYTRTA